MSHYERLLNGRLATRGRPARPRSDFQVQKARKACLCQRITVWGRTTWSASRHPTHWSESHTQKRRSRRPNCGRFERRRSRTSCCRSARFSSARSLRVLSDARSAPNRDGMRRPLSQTEQIRAIEAQALAEAMDGGLASANGLIQGSSGRQSKMRSCLLRGHPGLGP